MATYTGISAATSAVTNRFVASVNMANGAYTVANASPSFQGACFVVATITAVTGNDTPGSLTIVGKDLNNQDRTEVLALVAGGTATGTVAFRSITSITQSGWTINGGNDTIVVGHGAGSIVCGTAGTLYAIVVNATAAATITVADANRTIATLASSIANGHYVYGQGVDFAGYLRVTTTSTNDITVVHSPTSTTAVTF